jgi:hypothetical protein
MLGPILNKPRDGWHRMARGWLVIGIVALAFLAVFAIAVFGFDAPVHDRDSGELESRTEVVRLLLFLTTVCAIFATAGWLILFWLRRINQ